jgi:hypothetical protein
MKRVFSTLLAPLAAGLCLRLIFVLKFPAISGDTILYEQMATNWLQHHVYAMNIDGAITPVDLRMPGYPAFLALIYLLSGRVGAAAHNIVMFVQVLVDLLDCLAIAALAVALSAIANRQANSKSVFTAALWLSALCPFIGNYSATLLTETIAVFLSTGALFFLVVLASNSDASQPTIAAQQWNWNLNYRAAAIFAGFVTGLGTLFRPETPLLLIAAWLAGAIVYFPSGKIGPWLRIVILSGIACALPLLPWALRNAITLHELQFLAPRNSNLPSELVPKGFMAWEKTWLFRVSDCYLVSWKLNGDVIDVDTIPARAFDSPEEKDRASAILEPYNNDLTLTPQEDAAFAQLARERTRHRPLRTYVYLPIARAFTLWFTPRIELLPVSGTVFPLRQSWSDDKRDQCVTVGFFFLNILYVALGIYGAACLWRQNPVARSAVLILVVFVLLRTAFLTTLETPEPRYVLECYPVVLAFAATLFSSRVAQGDRV